MPLFHYTDIQAVHSILKNKKIWLTDIRFLNDREELQEGLTVIEETLRNDLKRDSKYANDAAHAIRHNLICDKVFGSDLDPLYVFSLSSQKDQLSQWRSYGNYAIEFDEDFLRQQVEILTPCIYQFNEKVERSICDVDRSVSIIEEEMEKLGGCIGPQGVDAMISLMRDAATYKHQGFVEENESRVIVQNDINRRVHYRARGEFLVPYIEFEISLDCIKSIQVGPMKDQELAFLSMREFVCQIERDWQIDSLNPEYSLAVEKSLIPYRV